MEFRKGNLKFLWRVTYPIMVFFFFEHLMLFVDRYYLSRLSLNALKASVSGGMFAWTVICGGMALVQISEVFVAQFYGAKKYNNIGPYVWQSVWVSAFLGVVLIVLAFVSKSWLFQTGTYIQFEQDYFLYICFTAPFFLLFAALSGFFIGRAEGSIVMIASLVGNVINITLDPILIFGSVGVLEEFSLSHYPLLASIGEYVSIPSYGVKGAAWGTLIGTIIQVWILAYFLLRKKYRSIFNTGSWGFNWGLTKKLLQLGTPSGVFVTLDLLAWSIFYIFMKDISEEHMLIAGLCHTVLSMCYFYGLGLEKGAAAASGNLVGAKCFSEVVQVFYSGLVLILLFSFLGATLFHFYVGDLIDFFIYNEWNSSPLSKLMDYADIKLKLQKTFLIVGSYLIIDNVRLLIYGILTGVGDTFFIMLLGLTRTWMWMLLPTYFIIILPKGSIEDAYYIWIVSSLAALFFALVRLFKGHWQAKRVVNQ
jgi:multidrug resistance protein, MATE family